MKRQRWPTTDEIDEMVRRAREERRVEGDRIFAEIERSREWCEAHPEGTIRYKRRRCARKIAAGGSFSEAQFEALCEFYDNLCLRCGESKELTRDHVIPLVDGGSNEIMNIQPLCRRCNSLKGTKHTDYRGELPEWESLSF